MRLFLCYLPLFLLILISMFLPLIPQPAEYHVFAGSRLLIVGSNLGFIVLGLVGTFWTIRKSTGYLWCLFFLSIFLIGIGSSIYHLHPNNLRLYVDRLPMAIAFMSITAALTYERVPNHVLPVCLLLFALAAPTYWIISNDLRPYLVLQVFPFLTIPLLLFLFQKPSGEKKFLLYALLWIIASKFFEFKDAAIYAFTGDILSGHMMKHLLSAVGIFYVLRYLKIGTSS